MTFPTQVRTAAYGVLQTVQTAHASLLANVHSARPAAIAGLPAAWVDDVRFTLNHDMSLRTWLGEAEVWIAYDAADNEDGQSRADVLLGYVLDAFTDDPHWPGVNTIGEPRGVRSDSFDGGEGGTYPALVVTLGRIQMQEGRT